jgi:hypothetical protein
MGGHRGGREQPEKKHGRDHDAGDDDGATTRGIHTTAHDFPAKRGTTTRRGVVCSIATAEKVFLGG